MSSYALGADAVNFSIQANLRFSVLVRSHETGRIMTRKQQQAWRDLCLRAVQEPDPAKQMEIVAELNRRLQRRQKPASAAPLVSGVLKQRPAP
jgi:hypothetical protein